MVAQALTENQLNLEAFNQTIGQKEFPNCGRLADDVNSEHKVVKRKVAIETAKRVLLQFYKAVDKTESSTQTEIDQIEYLRKFYESQIDSLFNQIEKLKKEKAELHKVAEKAKEELEREKASNANLRVRLADLRNELTVSE